MAAIQNDRDLLLQATSPRLTPILIPIDQIDGLQDKIDTFDSSITSALSNTKNIVIYASATSFIGTTTTSPTNITLTAEKRNGLTGTVSWSVLYGSATLTPSGDTCSVAGSSVVGSSVTIRARVTVSGVNYDAYVTLTRLGTLSGQATVNLASQVTGQLASGNITGLGALALLNTVDLNTQTTGALNGQTQVTNLGTLAYANAIAANQIGAGTLAAGVIYAGAINADNITSGTITGRIIRTAASGARYILQGTFLEGYDASNTLRVSLDFSSGTSLFISTGFGPGVLGRNPSSGQGVTGESVSGSGLYGESSSGAGITAESETGFGGVFLGNSTKANIRLPQLSALPTDRSAGSVCFYGGWLCFANGGHWFKSDGTQLT